MVEEHNGASVAVQAAGEQCVGVIHPGPSLSPTVSRNGGWQGDSSTHPHTHTRVMFYCLFTDNVFYTVQIYSIP